MGSAAGIQQHIAEFHLFQAERIYVVRRYVARMMDEEPGTTMMQASAELHHALHLAAQVRDLNAHDPATVGTLVDMLRSSG